MDRLFAACNRLGIHDVHYQATHLEYHDGQPGSVHPADVILGGWDGCRAEFGDSDGEGSRLLMNRMEGWSIRSGEASPLTRQIHPEFHPFLPALTMSWAFSAMRSEGRLELSDRGTETLNGQPCRIVEAIHRGYSMDASPATQMSQSEPDRRYRLYLDGKSRLVRLDYRGFSFLYENYTKHPATGLIVATSVRCYAQGVHQWDHRIDVRSIQAIDRPDPVIFTPAEELQKGLLVLKEDEFSAEKIWNENRPDVMGGDAPFGTFHGDSVASVNIQNLNLNISIPFADYPQRGAVGLPMGLTYNSKLWDMQCSGTQSWFGSTPKAPPQDRAETYSLIYSSGSLNGWRNLSGLYSLQHKREYYDHRGKGVAEELAISPFYAGPPLKILPKMYLHMPDGSVHELMEDDGPGTGDDLHDRYSPTGIPYESITKDWESTDGSQIQVKLGDRGNSYDVLVYDATTLYVANLGPGFRVLDITDPQQIESHNVDTPWGATRLIRKDNYLLVGTNGAGVQLYDITSPDETVFVSKAWLNKGGVVDMKYEPVTHRLWVLCDGQLHVLDMNRPAYAKVLASYDVAYSSFFWGSAASPLEVAGNYGYVAQEGEIGIYEFNGSALTRSSLSFQNSQFRSAHYKCLVQDIVQHKLYAMVDIDSSDKRISAFSIGIDGSLDPLPSESFSVTRLGNRMILNGNHLFILGITVPEGGCGVDVFDRTNPSTNNWSHTLFTTAYRPRSTGLALSPDGTQLYITGDSWCVSAFDRGVFCSGSSTEALWDYNPIHHDPAIYFPNGTRVILSPEHQKVMDANGNFILMSQPLYSAEHFTYQDTLNRSGLASVLPWYAPPGEGGASPIPNYDPYNDPPPDPIDYTLPGFDGGTLTYTMTYLPLSEFAVVALTSRSPYLEYIENLPCASNLHGLFPASGGSGTPQIVENVSCFNPLLLAQIEMPNERAYSFDYNQYGEITRITYPTDGYEAFDYGRVELVGWQYDRYANFVNRGVKARYISANGTGSDLCAYVYESVNEPMGSIGGFPAYYRVIQRVKFYADATQMTGTPDALEEHYFYKVDTANSLVIAYGMEPLCSGKEYETRLYLKNESTGQMELHQRVLRQYTAGVYNPSIALRHPATWKLLGLRNPMVTAELAYLFDADGQPQRATLTTYEYEHAAAPNSYFKYGRLIETKSYDYIDTLNALALTTYNPEQGLGGWIGGGAFGASSLLRVEKTEYDDDAGFLALNRVQQASRSWVEDGDENKVNEALFDYDDPAFFDGSTGGAVPNWDDVGAVRGNLSHISRWIDGANYAIDSRKVNRFGQVIQYVDPVEQITDWEYGGGTEYSGYHAAYVTAVVKHPSETLELRTGYEYDSITGKLTAVIDPNDTVAQPVVATFDYDDDLDRLTQAVEPNGREIVLAYDDDDRIITVTADWDPENAPLIHQETRRHFDGLGRLTAEAVKVGPANAQPETWRWSQREYDARGRLWKVYNPTASQGTQGVGVTATAFDSLDRPTRVTNPDGTHQDTLYDLFNVSCATPTIAEKVSDENGKWKTYSRDAAGRIVQVIEEDPDTDTDGPVTTYVYTPSGKLSEVHQDAQTRSFVYDGLGNLVSAEYPEIDFEKIWEYHPNGQLHREYVNDYQSQWIEYHYDSMGRVNHKFHIRTDGFEETIDKHYFYAYDGQSQPEGAMLDPGDFPLGRLTGKWQVDPSDEEAPWNPMQWWELYAYDISGRVVAKNDRIITQEMFNKSKTQDRFAYFHYNISGGLGIIDHPSGQSTTFTLDLENRPLSAGDASSRMALASNLTYHVAGGIDTVTVPYLQEEARADLSYHREYDPLMLHVETITLNRGTKDVPMSLGYDYDANGNIASIGYAGGFGGLSSETYTYDNLNRLSAVGYGGGTGIAYAYDRFGNMLSQTVNGLDGQTEAVPFDFSEYAAAMATDNRLPTAAGFQSDPQGNLVIVEHAGSDRVETFEYDAENRLERYSKTWTAPDETPMWVHANYRYNDGFERLEASWSEEMEYVDPETGPEWYSLQRSGTRYFYAPGGEVLTEEISGFRQNPPSEPPPEKSAPVDWREGREGTPATDKSFVTAATSSEIKYQFTDHLGTTRYTAGLSWMLQDNDGAWSYVLQAVESPEHVTPYGSLLYPTGSGIDPEYLLTVDPILFTGKPRDLESGLDYFMFRYYSASYSRWTRSDPLVIRVENLIKPQGWNLYAYVESNPVRFVDIFGLESSEERRPKKLNPRPIGNLGEIEVKATTDNPGIHPKNFIPPSGSGGSLYDGLYKLTKNHIDGDHYSGYQYLKADPETAVVEFITASVVVGTTIGLLLPAAPAIAAYYAEVGIYLYLRYQSAAILTGNILSFGNRFRWHSHNFTPMRGAAAQFGMNDVKGAIPLGHINLGRWHIFNPLNANTRLVTGSKYKFWRKY